MAENETTRSRLAKYNEIILAVAGTTFLVAVVVLTTLAILNRPGPWPDPGIVMDEPGKEKPLQNLAFCSAITDATGAFQYIPVAAVNARSADEDVHVSAIRATMADPAYQPSYFNNCADGGYSGNSRTFNVIVRELKSNSQHLLLDHPGQVHSAALPDAKCAQGEGQTPCGRILWFIRSTDTNDDGIIDGRDAVIAYASDLDARGLVALTPRDSSVLDVHWVVQTNKWQFRIQRDTNHDGTLSDEDGSDLIETDTDTASPATNFLQDSISKSLNDAIR